MPTQLPITPEQLPVGFCPATYQDLLNEFSSHQSVSLELEGRQWVFSQSKPSDTTLGWWKIDSLGQPQQQYLFAQGAWLSRHPDIPGMTKWWFDTIPDFTSFDGGDNTTTDPTPNTGPMWQLARFPSNGGTIIAARFPLANGTLPSGKVLNVGDDGGDETNILTSAQTPVGPHSHDNGTALSNTDPTNIRTLHGTQDVGIVAQQHPTFDTDTPARNAILTGAPINAGGGDFPAPQPVSNMPPYVVGVLIQRTIKLFYVIR